jgi:hypothetical protein
VYLGTGAAADTLPVLRREAESLMRSAGYTLDFRDSRNRADLDARHLVVVEFTGDCSAPSAPLPAATPIAAGRSLASATVQDGVILPFTRVDCAAVRAILKPLVDREAPARRAYLYGRAMGRLIAHELYHVMAQTLDHAAAGVGRPAFSAADLVSDRFEFEAVALNRLRRAAEDTVDPSTDASGRQ